MTTNTAPIWPKIAEALDSVGLNDDDRERDRRDVITITVDSAGAIAELTAAHNRLLINKLRDATARRGDRVIFHMTAAGIELYSPTAFLASVAWEDLDRADLVQTIDDALAKAALVGAPAGDATYAFGPERMALYVARGVGKCRVCGCTDDDCSGCVARTETPCFWVEEDLCSACVSLDDLQPKVHVDDQGRFSVEDGSGPLSIRCPRPEKCNFPDCQCFGTSPA